MTDLLTAVDALTKPVTLRVIQSTYETEIGPDGRPTIDEHGNPVRHHNGTTTIKVTNPPLLDMLDAAVRGELNTIAGASESMKSTRGMLDSDALYHFAKITTQIGAWARTVGAPRRETPTEQLRAWYVTYTQQEHEEPRIRWHTRTMHGWANIINDKLDPHDEWTEPDPCPDPECVQGFDPATGRPIWWDPRTREPYPYPLVVRFRRTDGPLMVENARARCRACGRVWSVRELAYDLEQTTTGSK
jgi:hypothetical protein